MNQCKNCLTRQTDISRTESGKRKSQFILRRMAALIMAAAMIITTIVIPPAMKKADAATTLSNPSIVPPFGIITRHKATWDCIYFGSYPQTEVINTEISRNNTDIGKEYMEDGDFIVSDSIYNALKNATNWDANGEIVLNGTKYRRVKKSDVEANVDLQYWCRYQWKNSSTRIYHYFRYEPIKWRVLNVDGDTAFLLADKALDNIRYHISRMDVTWETSTIRSWLNGYTAASNIDGVDYSKRNFIDTAFTEAEQAAICNTSIINADNRRYGTSGGNDTTDKIFLLSQDEVCTESYGFSSSSSDNDLSRICKSTTYGKAMGIQWPQSTEYEAACMWWLRSPGDAGYTAMMMDNSGHENFYYDVDTFYLGMRPALKMNLSSVNLWTYAGTVCSTGTESVPIEGISFTDRSISMSTKDKYQLRPVITPSNATFQDMIYTSSDTKVATVDKNGMVTAVKNGRAVITATTFEGKHTAKVTVTVKDSQKIKTEKTKYTKVYGDKAFNLRAKTSGNGRLTYQSSNTKVVRVSSTGRVTIKGTGKAAITIKASETGKYNAAEKQINITVNPKRITVKKLSSANKGKLKITWNRASKVSGYEIIVASDKNFTKGKKTLKIKSYKTTSKEIGGLKSGRIYYVKVRGYKTVNGKKLYGKYSRIQKIRID